MTKSFYDFCGKETPLDKLKLLVVCDNPRSDGKEYYDICEDCLGMIHTMIDGKMMGEKK